MKDRPIRPNPHAAKEAKARHAAAVTIMVIASATSVGRRDCSRCCSGQTIAMMKSASARGAKTLAA
jgi:hypothetical protein